MAIPIGRLHNEAMSARRTASEAPPPPAVPQDAPPVSRLGRLARLTALAPRALPVAAEAVRRALGANRTAEEERAARERVLKSAKKTAEVMLKTLGEMKGLPLKLGQMASYIDGLAPPDRKSTRLNSSHVENSYAVFCLKKKKKTLTAVIYIEKKKNNKKM